MGEQDGHKHVIVIGAGAIGCALLPLLATLPVDQCSIIDGDTIERSNLKRQPLYGPSDIHRLKVEIAAERMRHSAPEMKIVPVPHFVGATNANELLRNATVIADCTDDLHARMLIDRYCKEHRIPLVSGSVFTEQFQVLTLHVPTNGRAMGFALSDYYPGKIGQEQDGCDMQNVPVMVPSMAAALMAWRISDLINGGNGSADHMDICDLKHGRWMRITPPQEPGDIELIAGIQQRVSNG